MKKSILTLFLGIAVLSSIIFLAEQQESNALPSPDTPQIRLNLLGPYGQVLYESASRIDNAQLQKGGSKETTKTTISFQEQDEYFTRDPDEGISDFCGEGGGDYHLEYYLKVVPDKKSMNGFLEKPLFSCLTSFDLLNLINVPQNWENDELLVYCSDTGRKPSNLPSGKEDTLSSFLFSQLSKEEGYMGCLVKNSEVDNGTLFYGFPYGNVQLEKERSKFYNPDAETTFPILSEYESKSPISVNNGDTMMKFKKEDSPHDLFLSYFTKGAKPFFIISNSNEAVNNEKSLTSLFDTSKIKDKTARTLLLRKFENKTLYGYKTQQSMVSSYSLDSKEKTQNPVYFIHYDGFGITRDFCRKTLAAYKPENSISNRDKTTVVCYKSDILLQADNLNNREFTTQNYNDLAFTLFKNIITDANGKGSRELTPPTQAGSLLERRPKG